MRSVSGSRDALGGHLAASSQPCGEWTSREPRLSRSGASRGVV